MEELSVIQPVDENFLKKFSRDFYQKIIETNDYNTFEYTISEWIKSINKDTELILEYTVYML